MLCFAGMWWPATSDASHLQDIYATLRCQDGAVGLCGMELHWPTLSSCQRTVRTRWWSRGDKENTCVFVVLPLPLTAVVPVFTPLSTVARILSCSFTSSAIRNTSSFTAPCAVPPIGAGLRHTHSATVTSMSGVLKSLPSSSSIPIQCRSCAYRRLAIISHHFVSPEPAAASACTRKMSKSHFSASTRHSPAEE